MSGNNRAGSDTPAMPQWGGRTGAVSLLSFLERKKNYAKIK